MFIMVAMVFKVVVGVAKGAANGYTETGLFEARAEVGLSWCLYGLASFLRMTPID